MRVAFVHPRFPSSEGTGATHSATQIVNGLANAGHSVTVLCTIPPSSNYLNSNVKLEHLDGGGNHPHTNTELNEALLNHTSSFNEYDVVHSYLPSLIPAVGTIASQTDVGTVVTLNAYGGICAKNDLLYKGESQCRNKSTAKCVNCVSRTGFSDNENGYLYQTASQLLSLRLINSGDANLHHIDAFRAPSMHVRDNYVEFGYDPEKISVVPHPVDEKFSVAHESSFTEPFRLLYVGSLSHHKGVEKLVPVVAALNQSEYEFYLTIVGTGGLEDEMQSQVRELGVKQRVDFRGFVSNSDLPAVYSEHDLFLYPGIWEEPLGRVYLEALATGTPIVSSDYGSIEDIVGDAGVLTDGSVEDFRGCILSAVESGMLPAMSSAAKEQVRQFELSHVIEGLEGIYRGAING